MRSVAIAAASVVGAASAQTNNANVNAAIAGCVNICQPILTVSSQCGFPVPSDPTVALNPVAWGGIGWGNGNNWGTGGNWGNGWGGWGGNWGGFGGWKKRDVQGSVPANTLNAGFLSGNWGGNWNSNLQCVCNTQSFDLDQVGSECLSCVNSALNVAYGNPWLNLLATSCGFGVIDPNDYYGLGWKKSKRSPQDSTDPSPAATTPDASALPVDTTPTGDAGSAAATPAPATPDSDGTAAPSLSQKGYAGTNGGGPGGWAYPAGYNGGGAVPAAVPVGAPASGGSSSGNNVVPVSGGGPSSGGSGGIGSGSQPVFFAGAPKTSPQGVVGAVAVAGSMVLFFGRALF